MIVYQTNISTEIIYSANHGIFYICSDLGSGLYGTNRGIVKVANS